MSAREELALVLANAQRVRNGSSTLPSADQCSRLAFDDADAILAAGYSKPRTITTVEELDALADDSVVLDDMDGPLIKVGDWWHSPTDEMRSHSVIVPTTILYTPKES